MKKLSKNFKEFTDALPNATVVLNTNATIEWWNKAAANLIGLHTGQDEQRAIAEILNHPIFIEYLNSPTILGPVEFAAPYNHNLILSISLIPYGHNHRLLLAQDITHLHHLEIMRRDFVANLSHELRTPLTVIRGYLETLIDENAHELKSFLRVFEQMQNQALRMERLVEDLLLLSRLEIDLPERNTEELISMPALLSTIRNDALALSGERKHRIHLDINPNLQLYGQKNELRSAFSNLVFNAVHYTPAHGDIYIRWYQDQNGNHLEVKDTGIGIDPIHIPRLTERFYRVDSGRTREGGGTGLGLAIVKHVLLRHQAHLHIESELNSGSIFRCDFPD